MVCESVPTRVSGKAIVSATNLPRHDHGRHILEVDLVDDAGPRWHDAKVLERLLRPAQELIPLAVPFVLQLHVLREGQCRAEAVDLDRVIDDEIGRYQRIDPRDIAAQRRDGVAHRGQVNDGRHAGEVLQHNAPRQERKLQIRLLVGG